MLKLPLALVALGLGAGAGQAQQQPGPMPKTVYISEVMTSNKLYAVGGETPDWIELANYGGEWVDLNGFRLSDKCDFDSGYALPGGQNVGPNERIVFLADGSGRSINNNVYLDFRLSSSGETVCLYAPDGELISKIEVPALERDQSFGLVAGVQPGGSGSDTQVLARATPGEANSEAAAPQAFDVEAVHPGAVAPDQSFQVELVSRGDSPVRSVDLTYLVDRGSPTTVTMSSSGDTYTATIPGQNAGSMVQWAFTVTDSTGQRYRYPSFDTPWDREFYGTFVDSPSMATALPVVYMNCKDDKAPFTVGKDADPGCSVGIDCGIHSGEVMLHGKFYDNVIVRRRGMSSIAWPKPKFKVDAGYQGKIFELDPSSDRAVKEFAMNSEWFEPGENTFMRETLAWKALAEMGVPSLDYYQTQARLNGAYFGKFSLGEDWDTETLKEAGYSAVGPLMKSMSGDKSNLRWDIDPWTSKYFYRPITIESDDAFIALSDLTTGLAGGTCGSRSAFVYDNLDLPKVINYMSAMTLLLNQDRCTKNFYVYRDPQTDLWSMLPWDVEAALATDRGLGGKPAPDYCILDCEQWNSPLFCDKNHPQDLLVTTPWGLLTTDVNPDRAARRLQRLRRLLDEGEGLGEIGRTLLQANGQARYPGWTPETPPNGAAVFGLELDEQSAILPGWDADQRTTPIVNGVQGTYNYLIDAILSIPTTRAMAMRRLRTLMDEFLAPDGSGRLSELVNEEHQLIQEEAARDIEFWGSSGSAERGYKQLLYEQLPIRASQLYGTYSSTGSVPLIPDSQPADVSLSVDKVDQEGGFVRLVNSNDIAVDISGRKLVSAEGDIFEFEPGTVVPAGMRLLVASDPKALRDKLAAANGGCSGEFIVGGGFAASELAGGASFA